MGGEELQIEYTENTIAFAARAWETVRARAAKRVFVCLFAVFAFLG